MWDIHTFSGRKRHAVRHARRCHCPAVVFWMPKYGKTPGLGGWAQTEGYAFIYILPDVCSRRYTGGLTDLKMGAVGGPPVHKRIEDKHGR